MRNQLRGVTGRREIAGTEIGEMDEMGEERWMEIQGRDGRNAGRGDYCESFDNA